MHSPRQTLMDLIHDVPSFIRLVVTMHSLDPNVTPSGFQRGWCGPPVGSVGDSLLSSEWGTGPSPGWMRGGDQLLHLRAGGADAAGGAAGLPHHPHGAEAPAGDAGDGQGGAPRHGMGGGPALRGAALHKVQLIPPLSKK